MARIKYNETSKFLTRYGKKVINLNVSPEFEKRIFEMSQKMSLTRPAYILLAVNDRLAKDELSQLQQPNVKRPIKFRGRTPEGQTVYGDFVHYVPMSSFPGIIDDEDFYHEVDPDSVAQLVGFDKHGCEVYEGDFCLDADGKEFKAVFEPDFFKNATLKETDHEEEIPASAQD